MNDEHRFLHKQWAAVNTQRDATRVPPQKTLNFLGIYADEHNSLLYLL